MESQEPIIEEKFKRKKKLVLLVTILVLAVVGLSCFFFQQTPRDSVGMETIETFHESQVKVDEVAVEDWQTYTNNEFGLQVEYPFTLEDPKDYPKTFEPQYRRFVYLEEPETWQAMPPREDGSNFEVFFGPPKTYPDTWAMRIELDGNLEQRVKETDSNFEDRVVVKNDIEIDGHPALFVRATTPSDPDWVSLKVFLEKDGVLYSLSGSGVTPKETLAFERFYKSFKFVSQ